MRARALSLAVLLIAQNVFAQDANVLGWSLTYADGRVMTYVAKAKGGMWTPKFPKLQETRISASGVARYLDFQYVRDQHDLVFTVSLATDGFRDRVPVTTVRVRRNEPVIVEALRKFGVAPVTLALTSIPPVLNHPPIVSEISGQLLVDAEPVSTGVPVYRVRVTNQSSRVVRAFDFEAYDSNNQTITGRRKTERNEPLLLPDQTFSFELTLSNRAGEPWRTIDNIVISTVIWDDGAVDGDPKPAEQERSFAIRRASQLRALVARLQRAIVTPTADAVRHVFTSTDRSDRVLDDARQQSLAEFEAQRRADSEALAHWLSTQIASYTAWLARCERAAATPR